MTFVVPGAGLEPARKSFRGILSPLRLPNFATRANRSSVEIDGGRGRIRTGVDGFAGRCITPLPPGQTVRIKRRTELHNQCVDSNDLERETRFELATSTLARLRSTG